jgi:hypothetical protein
MYSSRRRERAEMPGITCQLWFVYSHACRDETYVIELWASISSGGRTGGAGAPSRIPITAELAGFSAQARLRMDYGHK